jgi:hypothetical protein
MDGTINVKIIIYVVIFALSSSMSSNLEITVSVDFETNVPSVRKCCFICSFYPVASTLDGHICQATILVIAWYYWEGLQTVLV